MFCCFVFYFVVFFFFKQKTAYEMRISDWSSDVCSSDLREVEDPRGAFAAPHGDGEESREHTGGEACRQQVRREEVLLVVPPHVLPQGDPHRTDRKSVV